MAGNTFIAIPPNVTDPTNLKRFLSVLVEKLDIAFGNRGVSQFATTSSISTNITSLSELIDELNNRMLDYAKVDGSTPFTDVISYSANYLFSNSTDIISKKYADDKFMPVAGTKDFTDIVSYDENKTFTSDTDIIAKKYVDDKFMPVAGTKDFTDIVNYDENKTFTNETDIISKKYVDDNFTNNPAQSAIADLGLTISNPPTQTQVQAISNKVDTILAALRSANIIN